MLKRLKESVEQAKGEEERVGKPGQTDERRRIGRSDLDGLIDKKCDNSLLESGKDEKDYATEKINETKKKKLKGIRRTNNEKEIRTTIHL